VDHAGGNGVRRMDEGNAGTGAQSATKSMGSAHATETVDAQKGNVKTTAVNPKGGANAASQSRNTSGENPLYESRDKAVPKKNTRTSDLQPYKDPEDMTTRYRPGNNKTSAHGASHSAAASSHP
jgi:hypothetical protein